MAGSILNRRPTAQTGPQAWQREIHEWCLRVERGDIPLPEPPEKTEPELEQAQTLMERHTELWLRWKEQEQQREKAGPGGATPAAWPGQRKEI